jgi:hypothetical protein
MTAPRMKNTAFTFTPWNRKEVYEEVADREAEQEPQNRKEKRHRNRREKRRNLQEESQRETREYPFGIQRAFYESRTIQKIHQARKDPAKLDKNRRHQVFRPLYNPDN